MWLNLLRPRVRDCVSNSKAKKQPKDLNTGFHDEILHVQIGRFPPFILLLKHFSSSDFSWNCLHGFMMDKFCLLFLYKYASLCKLRDIWASKQSSPFPSVTFCQEFRPSSCYDSKLERHGELLCYIEYISTELSHKSGHKRHCQQTTGKPWKGKSLGSYDAKHCLMSYRRLLFSIRPNKSEFYWGTWTEKETVFLF